MKINSNNKGGMLLFSIITAMVVSFICVTLVMLTFHQYKITDADCKRKAAQQWIKAGMEYAYYLLSNNMVSSIPYSIALPDNGDVTIDIVSPITGDPAGVSYRIEISTTY